MFLGAYSPQALGDWLLSARHDLAYKPRHGLNMKSKAGEGMF